MPAILLIRVLLLVAGFCCAVKPLTAQSVIPQNIRSDYTLHLGDSPFLAEDDVYVHEGARLTVEAGVEIQFAPHAGLYISGSVRMTGTESLPIWLIPEDGEQEWEVVTMSHSNDLSEFRYVHIRGCTGGDDANRDRAAVNASNVGEVSLYHVDIRDVKACVYFIDTSEKCVFEDCFFSCTERGSVFNLVRAKALIQNCEFAGVRGDNSDAIDFDKVEADLIGNRIYGMDGPDSDGIDLGSASVVYLDGNVISDCADSGIEAEEETEIVAVRNVIFDCRIGITVKELAVAEIRNQTLYNTDIGFWAYSESENSGRGGEVSVYQTIIANSDILYRADHGSEFVFRYNLTDPGLLTGTGNISMDPLFRNPAQYDFTLQPGSPAIDAGDPGGLRDPDGTIADIGAFWYEQQTSGQLVFSEIHYRPLSNGQEDSDREFIELFNRSASPVDVSGFQISGSITAVFPANTWLDGQEYIVVAENDSWLSESVKSITWTSGTLQNSGSLVLKSKANETLLTMNYDSQAPWPELTRQANLSIELAEPESSPVSPANWRYSFEDGGTPGRENRRYRYDGIFLNELVSKYGTLVRDEYGQPTDWIEVYNHNSFPVYLGGLALFDGDTDCPDAVLSHDDPDELRLPPQSYLLLYADDQSDLGYRHLPFQLRSAGEELTLARMSGTNCIPLDQVDFGPLDTDQSFGRFPDGTGDWLVMNLATPGAPNIRAVFAEYAGLVINELMARYDDSYPDEHGLFSDWIELFNSSAKEINIRGLYVSDQAGDPMKYQVPLSAGDSALILPGQYLILRADARPDLGFQHTDFELAGAGESVVLSVQTAQGLQTIDRIDYPAVQMGHSYGRLGDAGLWWDWFASPTPNAPNHTTTASLYPDKIRGFRVYPNPSDNQLHIRFPMQAEAGRIFLYSGDGRLIQSKEIRPWSFEEIMHTSHLPSGLYRMVYRIGGEEHSQLFTVF